VASGGIFHHAALLLSANRSSHQGVAVATDFMMQQQQEKDALAINPSSTTTLSSSSSKKNMASSYCIDTGVFIMEDNIAMEECVARNLARLQQGNVVPATRMEKILEDVISANSSASIPQNRAALDVLDVVL
jgi:hypothetical protein